MTALYDLLDAVRHLHLETPALRAFGDWPDDLEPSERPAYRVPALDLITALQDRTPLVEALKTAAPSLEWRQTYTEAEVGRHFLASYGYVELFGPQGHFHSKTLRGFLGFWGPGLQYGWHDHQAEELYFCLSGHARFYAANQPQADIAPGMTRWHAPFERHAMDTGDAPFLCYALWKGDGLADLPKMVTTRRDRAEARAQGREEAPA
ncbi:MAG: dimethylsulfonioproprionate lyase family protein [Pseudomonadota bacterium]